MLLVGYNAERIHKHFKTIQVGLYSKLFMRAPYHKPSLRGTTDKDEVLDRCAKLAAYTE